MSSKLRAGDILLYRGTGFVNKLIKFGTRSVYSHCAVCINPDTHILIEATTGLVRASDIRKTCDYDVYRVKEKYPYDLNKVVSYLVSTLNSKYDYLGVVYLGALKLLNRIGLPIKKHINKFQKDRDYFCSELVCKAFNYGGVTICKFAGVASPKDIVTSNRIEVVK